jgi:hypothetical protein
VFRFIKFSVKLSIKLLCNEERKRTMSKEPLTRRDLEAQIIAKAQADESFRQALLGNPKAAIEKEFGGMLREGVEIKVVEETADTLYLVLPAAKGELSETDLDNISGGIVTVLMGYKVGSQQIKDGTTNTIL